MNKYSAKILYCFVGVYIGAITYMMDKEKPHHNFVAYTQANINGKKIICEKQNC